MKSRSLEKVRNYCYNIRTMNVLHDIPAGDDQHINVIIEIPKGSHNKYEIDKKTGLIALDRALSSTQHYPYDYGFVPQTHWKDGDPLDVIVLTTSPLFPGVLVKVRPVAIMHMIDNGEHDEKIIAVPAADPRWVPVQDLKDINPHTIKELEHFYLTYKNLEHKEVNITGFEGVEAARKAFEEGKAMYLEKHSGTK